MHQDDWIILIFTILFIVVYGSYKTRKNKNIQSFLKGDNSSNWFTIGISVMATQASAITFLSTPGQGYYDGMGFLQFYLGLPLAMIIICIFFVPLYHKLKIYTAYEFLENRFDRKTRTLGAILFLVQRGLAAGITIFAPSIILSTVLGIDIKILNFLVGFLVIVYTVSGGTKAVNITQKQQMFVIFLGLFFVFFFLIDKYPENLTISKFLDYSRSSEKFKILDFSLDINNRYTFWSGITGGLFLALSYFGTDQSQVQRYLSGKSLKEMQLGMIFNGIFKIPMQFFILFIGVMVFVFYQFNPSPINFNPQGEEVIFNTVYQYEYIELKESLEDNFKEKTLVVNEFLISENQELKNKINNLSEQEQNLRDRVKTLIDKAAVVKNQKIESNDKDYVFIHFILENLPKGLIGLVLAVIISAAMSSTSSEINALATTTSIDILKRNFSYINDDNIVFFTNVSNFF